MTILKITWHDYPVDDRDFDLGIKDETYEETFECDNFVHASKVLSKCDGQQYNGHEIQITNLAVYQYGEKILINIPGSTDCNKTGRYSNG